MWHSLCWPPPHSTRECLEASLVGGGEVVLEKCLSVHMGSHLYFFLFLCLALCGTQPAKKSLLNNQHFRLPPKVKISQHDKEDFLLSISPGLFWKQLEIPFVLSDSHSRAKYTEHTHMQKRKNLDFFLRRINVGSFYKLFKDGFCVADTRQKSPTVNIAL